MSSTIIILNSVRTSDASEDASLTAIPQVIIEPPKPHLYLDIQCTEDEIPCGNTCMKHNVNTLCQD